MPDLNSYVLNVIFGLISAGLLAFCRHLNKKLKEYQNLVNEKENDDIEAIITRKLEPIQESIKVLKAYIDEVASKGETLRTEAMNYKQDMFDYQLGNIQALPYSLTKVTSLNNNNKIFPLLEYYTCTDREKDAFAKKLAYNGMTVMVIDKPSKYINNKVNLEILKELTK